VSGKVLIIEDDADIAALERDYLEAAGFETETVADGRVGLECALQDAYDLVVVDLMLPGANGFEICRALRRQSQIPVMVVSARSEDIDKVRALGLGIDDYVEKPFSPAELVARVKAHITRYRTLREEDPPQAPLTCGTVALDPTLREVRVAGRSVLLTVLEYQLLELFMRHPGRVFSRDELFERVWDETYGDLGTVTVHIRRLRRKIEPDPAAPTIIQTVWGMGYRLRSQRGDSPSQ
jgi:DNA-binding response OmpR family regulator